MDFKPLSDSERKVLLRALEKNARGDGAVLMDPRDTSFTATDVVDDDEVINAIRSVPCHY